MTQFKSRSLGRIIALLLGSACACAAAPLPSAPGTNPDEVADRLLTKMTRDDKVAMIRGLEEPHPQNEGEAGYLVGVPRLGIPHLRMADGPPGLLLRDASAAEVATMGVAATFDPELARQNGVVIADEARRLGIDVVLQPFINFDRDISYSRAYNTFGEDPLLTGTIGAAEIRGIQERGVLADAKHFVGYDTDGQNVFIDEQALHEIYLAPFAAAIDAGVSTIMCSYNRINGPYACGNAATLTTILRGELGFKGFVISDWGAVHDNLGLTEGLDMEMPGQLMPGNPFAGILPSYYDIARPPHHVPPPDYDKMHAIFEGTIPEEPQPPAVKWAALFPANKNFRNLYDALHDGSVTDGQITLAAHRVLREMARFGRVPGALERQWPQRLTQAQINDIDQRTSEESAVLLKNDNHALPLTQADLGDLAIIGPGGRQVVAVGKASERSLGELSQQIGPAEAFSRLAGPGGHIVTAVADEMDGYPIPAAVLTGLSRIVDGGKAEAGADLISATGTVLPSASHGRWRGVLRTGQPGDYWLAVHVMGARIDVLVDGRRIGGTHTLPGGLHGDIVQANQDSLLPSRDGYDNVRVPVTLSAGAHRLELVSQPDGSGNAQRLKLAWASPDDRRTDFAQAVRTARAARKVVLFLWSRGQPVFGLPGDQDALAMAVLAANPNTVVVLNTSQPVALPWLDHAAAVVQMWWAGDRGGLATANVLTGRVDPAGRLPVTWARALTDYPANDPAHPERSAEGVAGRTTFTEGLDFGYRAFLRHQVAPLFPFGFGLSYTHFGYGDMKVVHTTDGGLNVSLTLSNLGERDGDEVPQLYLGAPSAAVAGAAFPVAQLAAFSRVHLNAGEHRRVTLHVSPRQLLYWSVASHAWRRAPGTRPIMVGASSTDIRLRGTD